MSYPQPIASQEIREGQEFYRLLTEIETSGDVYEMDVSAKAFSIGPESDIARARVTYFDAINNAHSFVVSVGAPFVGRVDASPTKKYVGGVPGNIIITPEDIIQSDYRSASVSAGDIVNFIKPRLDIVAALTEPRILPNKRAEFIQRGRVTIPAGEDTYWIYVPFYGRKFASISISNWTGSASYTAQIFGINFSLDGALRALSIAADSATAIPAPSGTGIAVEVKASLVGMFDYLEIRIAGNAVTGLGNTLLYTLRTSDEES